MPSIKESLAMRSRLLIAFVAICVAVGAIALPTPTSAADQTFGSGRVDWGFKQSFRDYILNKAHGSITAGAGATEIGEGVVRFPLLGGVYDETTRVGEFTLGGWARFEAHGGILDTTFAHLCVSVTGDIGTVYANAVAADRADPRRQKTYYGAAIGTLSGVSPPMVEGGSLTWLSIPVAVTATGTDIFGDYAAGDPIDPLAPLLATPGTPNPRPEGGGCRGVAPPGGGSGGDNGGDNNGGGKTGGDRSVVDVSTRARPIVVKGRVARIATLRCGAATSCKLRTPKKVKVKIKRKRYSAAVLAPKNLKAGKSGKLRVRLSKAARKALAGRRTTVKVKVTIVAAGHKTTRTIRATLKAKKAKRR